MQIATITTLNASLEDTLSFVHYHLNIGIDHLFLFFDNPNDIAISTLSKYSNITCIRCNQQHWKGVGCSAESDIEIRQTLNADLALNWCRKIGIDWIAHIDVDELIYTEQGKLKNILNSLQDSSYLSIQPLEAIPNNIKSVNPFREITNFKILIRDKNKLKLFPKQDETLYQGEFFRGHLSGKSFTRISENIKSINIHKPSLLNPELLIENVHKGINLLHYDCYDYENWLTKWFRRYDGTAKFNGRNNRNNQFLDFCKVFEEEDNNKLKRLYERMYLISPTTLDQLKSINAVKTIKLDEKLFEYSTE